MLLKHTKDFNQNELLKSITSLGGRYNAITDRDVTIYYMMTHMDNYKKAVNLMESIIKFPVFQEKELENELQVVTEELRKRSDNDTGMLNLSYSAILESDNLYARSVEGSEETITKIKPRDLYTYYKESYRNVVIAINCDAAHMKEVKRFVLSRFKQEPESPSNLTDISIMHKCTRYQSAIIVVPRMYQQYSTHLLFPGYPRGMVKQNVILDFLKYCLVSAGLYSLLVYKLRSKYGYVYNISALNETYRYVGLFRIAIFSSNHNTRGILKIAFDIMNDVCAHGIHPKMFAYFKKSYINEQKYGFTSDEYRTIFHGESSFYDCDVSDETYISYVESMTNDDVRSTAREILDFSKIGIMTYGKYKNINKVEKELESLVTSFM